MNKTTTTHLKEDVIKALISLGLSSGEAKIYTTLMEIGTAHASTIAREADVKQPKVYGYLNDLAKRTFIIRQEKEGKADSFTAVPYEQVMKTLEKEISEKIDSANEYFKSIKEKEKVRQVEDLFAYYEGKKSVSAGLKTIIDRIEKNIVLVLVNVLDQKLLSTMIDERKKEIPTIEILQLTSSEKLFRIPPIKKLMNTEGFSSLLARRPTMFYTDIDFESKTCSSMNILLPPIDDFSSALINIKHPVALHLQIQLLNGIYELLEKQGMFMKSL